MTSFAEILQPLTIGDFISSYWDKSYQHFRGGDPAKFAALPGFSGFTDFFCGSLGTNGWEPPILQGKLYATWIDARGAIQDIDAPLSPATASSLYNAGASLCFSEVDKGHPALASLVNDVAKHTGFGGEICTTAYLSPPHSGGPLHFDPQHVFFLQVSGEKHWKVSREPGVVRPAFHAMGDSMDGPGMSDGLNFVGWPSAPPPRSSLVDIVLKEGEVLYLPPGVWHEPRTNDSHSLHYTLTLFTISSWSVLFAFLRKLMMKEPEWRRDLRFVNQSAEEREEQLVGRMLTMLRKELAGVDAQEVLKLYRDTEALPRDLQRWFRSP